MKFKVKAKPTRHEIDATLAALAVRLYLENQAEAVGEPETGEIVIPKLEALKWLKTYPRRSRLS
ncbi:TPA: hypothetical protein EYP27_02845 [Candidatus Bathyarchaeota archaeon]|nr:hypothetical protein [Candidatus Bathyarchaeota archaeon]